jgi:predicted permease
MPAQLAQTIPPTIDARVLAFSLVLSTLTGLVFGLWPAFGATRANMTSTISLSGGYGSTAADGASLRRLFVVSEMAFALMLLIAAGLMFRSFSELLATDSGVKVEHVASVEVTLSRTKYANAVARSQFYDRLLDKVRSTPGFEAAAAINEIPLRGEWGIGIRMEAEGKQPAESADGVYPQYLRVTPGYFHTMGIRLLAGRPIEEQDDTLHRAAVINKAAAEKVWPGENALGKRFAFGTMPGQVPEYYTVVGIIADVRSQSLEQKPTPQMYLPFNDAPSNFAGIVARGSGEPAALLSALRTAIRQTDPEQAMFNLQMLDQAVARTIAPRRTNTLLIAVFGLLAVVLAAYGVYAVIAYGVAQRTREIGIRIALGAKAADVLRMVMREGLVLAALGIAIGLGGAWALSRIMESLLYGVSARDPFTFVAAPIVLLALALTATLVPARKAARTDPMTAIRTE